MFLQLSNEPFHNRKKILKWGEKKNKTKQNKKKNNNNNIVVDNALINNGKIARCWLDNSTSYF